MEFIGRFHPLLVHLPIGILLVAVLFDVLGKRATFQHLKTAVPMLYLLGALGAVFSCVTGFMLANSGEYGGALLSQHKWMGIGVAVGSLLIYGLRVNSKANGLILPIVLCLLLSGTGHLGGSLTHGEEYLWETAPEPLRTLMLGKEKKPLVIADVQEAHAYSDIVVPILENSCYRCHNDKKQKGKLRLDSPEFIAQGGKSKAEVIKAASVSDSELMRRIHLPISNEKHMPPSQKDELTDAEKALLEWWIETGADYEAQVKNLPQDDDIQAVLTSLENPIEEEATIDVPAPDSAAVAALRAVRAVVLPVGQESNLLDVNFINVAAVDSVSMANLINLQTQIVSLKMSGTDCDDADLSSIAKLSNLEKLYLDGTAITDVGLNDLLGLKKLKYLNVVNTELSKAGLESLKAMKNLKQLFIYQTATNASERSELVSVLDKTAVDTGGYIVPTFATDTTFIAE